MRRAIVLALAALAVATVLMGAWLFPKEGPVRSLRPYVYGCTAPEAGLDSGQLALLRGQNGKLGFLRATVNPLILVTDSLFGQYLQAVVFEGVFDLEPGTNTAVVPQGHGAVGGSVDLMGTVHEIVGVYTPHPLTGGNRTYVAQGGALDAEYGLDLVHQVFIPASGDQLGTARLTSHLLLGPGIAEGWQIEDYGLQGAMVFQWRAMAFYTGAVLLAILAARGGYGVIRWEARRYRADKHAMTAAAWAQENGGRLGIEAFGLLTAALVSAAALRLTRFQPVIPAHMLPPRYVLDFAFYREFAAAAPSGTPMAAAYGAAFAQGRTACLLTVAGLIILFGLGLHVWQVWEKRQVPGFNKNDSSLHFRQG